MINIKIFFIFVFLSVNANYLKAQASEIFRSAETPPTHILTSYNGNPTTEAKAGWNLIFSDGFNGTTLDLNKWNITGRDDDFPNVNDKNIWANPANVSVSGGACHLKLTNVPTWSTGNDYKPYSGAEIKTFTAKGRIIANNSDNIGDISYGFGVDTWIEMRVKLPGGKGAGSAGWLYNPEPAGQYREYDIWETYGNLKPKQFSNGYVYQTPGYVGRSGTNKNIETADGRYIDQDWYVFALERTELGYKSYINGQCVRDLKFTDIPPSTGCSSDGCPLAYPTYGNTDHMMLRLTALGALNPKMCVCDINVKDCNSIWNNQTNHFDCDGNFNKEMLVDYVRVYQRQNTEAVRIKNTPKTYLCTDNIWNSIDIKYSWYPDAVYTWTYPNALTKYVWHRDQVAFGFNQALTPVVNQTYPIALTITFPNGYSETKNFTVTTIAPVSVSPTMITPRATRTGMQCFYRLELSGTAPAGVTITSNPPVGDMLDPSSTYQVQICAKGICGGPPSCITKTLNTGSLTGCRGWVRPNNGNVAIDNEVVTDINSKSNNTEVNSDTNYNSELDNETVLSIKDIENNTILKKNQYDPMPLFYPNPIHQGEVLTFNTHDLPADECTITINDVLGSIAQKISLFKYQKAFITTDNLISGMYFVAVYNKAGQYLYAQKLVIQ